MRRTQIYLTQEEWGRLASISRDRGVTKSALIREAVDRIHLDKRSSESFSKALWAVHGLWKNRHDMEAPSSHARKFRRESGRRQRYLKKLWRKSS